MTERLSALVAVDLEEAEPDLARFASDVRALLAPLAARFDLLFVDPHVAPTDGLAESTHPPRVLALARHDAALVGRLEVLLAGWSPRQRGFALVRRGHRVADEIVACARDTDLVVVGTHARHGLPRAWLGSVAERVVRASPAPVLVVHPPLPDDASAADARVLAAVDLDDAPTSLLAEAARWAERLGARVDAVHVLAPPVVPDEPAVALASSWAEELVSSARRAEAVLTRLLREVPAPVRGRAVVARGDPARTIAAVAQGYRLAVVRTHARRGLGRLWLGSVAERVVRWSAATLVLRPTS